MDEGEDEAIRQDAAWQEYKRARQLEDLRRTMQIIYTAQNRMITSIANELDKIFPTEDFKPKESPGAVVRQYIVDVEKAVMEL